MGVNWSASLQEAHDDESQDVRELLRRRRLRQLLLQQGRQRRPSAEAAAALQPSLPHAEGGPPPSTTTAPLPIPSPPPPPLEPAQARLVDKFESKLMALKTLMRRHTNTAAYLTSAAHPLLTLSASVAALSIATTNLLLNARTRTAALAAGLLFLVLLTGLMMSLLFETRIARAAYRLARVKLHVDEQKLLEREDTELNQKDIAMVKQLTWLAKDTSKGMHTTEWLYQHVFWRLFPLFCLAVYVLALFGYGWELVHRLRDESIPFV